MEPAAKIIREFPIPTVYFDKPPDYFSPEQTIIWGLFKVILDPDKPQPAAAVAACRELGDRMWGKVPTVEYQQSGWTLEDLDLTRFDDVQREYFFALMNIARPRGAAGELKR